jgi:hypothetical protein
MRNWGITRYNNNKSYYYCAIVLYIAHNDIAYNIAIVRLNET